MTTTTTTTTTTTSTPMTTTTTTTTPTTTTTTTTTSTTPTTTTKPTTTAKRCTDAYWCRWKSFWDCKYYDTIQKHCPNKCGTCGIQTPTTIKPPCFDSNYFWCRLNKRRCKYSNRVR